MAKQTPYLLDPSLNTAEADFQQLAQTDAFLANFKTPTDIEEYKNHVLDTQFQQMGISSPYESTGDMRAKFKQDAEMVDYTPEDTPEQQAYKDIANRLVKFKGRLPEPDFLKKTFGNSMTAGWIKLLTGEDASGMMGDFGVAKDGYTYKGKKLKLNDDQNKTITDFINRTTGEDADNSFLDKIAQTAVSLTWDLPLMAITGGVAGGAMKATQVTSALAKSTSFLPRLLGQVVQQSVNFNLLGLPQTVTAFKDEGFDSGMSNIWHSIQMGTLAAGTASLGTKMFKPIGLEVLKRNPALAEELGGLAGSFGFGFLSTKIAGESTTDAMATGLAFAATHFTNPTAYKRVMAEQARKDIRIWAETVDSKGRAATFQPDYFVEKNGELKLIDDQLFKNEGKIEEVKDVDGIPINETTKRHIKYYNEIEDAYQVKYGEALADMRNKQNGKKLYDEWSKELPAEYVKENSEDLRSLAEVTATSVVGADLSKTFSKWRLPKDVELTNKMVKVSNDYSIPFKNVKKYVVSNITDYAKDPEGFVNRLKQFEQGYDNPVFKELTKVLDTAKKVYEKKANTNTLEITSDGKLKTTTPEMPKDIKMPSIIEGEKDEDYARRVLSEARFDSPDEAFNIVKAAKDNYRKLTEVKEEVKPLEAVPAEVETKVEVPKPAEVTPVEEEVKVETEVMPENPIRETQKPAVEEMPLSNTNIAPEKIEVPTPSKEESFKNISPINDLSMRVKEDRTFLSNVKESQPLIDSAFGESREIADKINSEDIPDAVRVPAKDIMTLTLAKSGHTEPEIAAIISKATGQTINEDGIAYIKSKYNPDSSKFNPKAYGRIANSDMMKIQQELAKEKMQETPVEEMKLDQPLTDMADVGVTVMPKIKQDITPEFADVREATDAALTDRVSDTRFDDALEVLQPIKNPDKKIQQVITEVDRMLGGREVTLDNYEKVADVMRNSVTIRKLGSGNFDANTVAEQIVQNRAMKRDDKADILYNKVETPIKPSTPEQISKAAETLRNELKDYGIDLEVSAVEQDPTTGTVRTGYTLFNSEGVKVRIDPEYANEATFNEERFHALTNITADTKSLNGTLKKYGWDGKGRNDSWNNANEKMYDAYKAFAQDYGSSNPMFAKIKEIYEKVSNWLKGNGYYSEGEFFRKYAEGKLKFNKVEAPEEYEQRLYNSIRNDREPIDPVKQNERLEALVDWNSKEKMVDLSDIGMNKILNSPLGKVAGWGKNKVYRYWTLSLPPAYTKYKMPAFAQVREIGESEVIRKSSMAINKIIRDQWHDGKYFRGLSETAQKGMMDANRQYEKDMNNGVHKAQLSTDEFIKYYKLSSDQAEAVRMYQNVKNASVKVARDGWFERLMEHTINVAGELNNAELKKFFPEIEKVDIGKANEFMASDKLRKEMVARYISNKLFDYGDQYYFNSVRPNSPSTWIIEMKRSDGKRISTYAKTKEKADELVKKYQMEGYGIGEGELQQYRIGDILKDGEYWNRLSEQQLLNLANAGHIDLNENVLQKLREAVKTGKLKQHGIDKEFIEGLHHTPEEWEKGLQQLVNESVYSNYRHNAIAKMKEVMGDFRVKLDTTMKDPNASADVKANMKLEYDYANAYINNITFSDRSAIDTYKGFVSTIYTALKPSFLFQQMMQPIQTTWAVAAMEAGGSKKFYNAIGETLELVKALQARRKGAPQTFVDKEKLDVYQDLADMNKLGKVGLEELTSEAGNVDFHYMAGVDKFLNSGLRWANMASGSIEKFTRLQAMNTFYSIGKENGLSGDKLVNFIADKIDESMSQWGAGGRAPLLSSKKAGVKAEPIMKAVDKSFMTFKTFATHNLGLYEKLFRDKQWGALGVKLAVGAGMHGITKFPMFAGLYAIANLFSDNDTDYEIMGTIEALDELTGTKIGTVLSRGIGGAAGMDLSDLFAENTIMPGDLYEQTRAKSAVGKLAEAMLGAPYGFASDVVSAASGMKDTFINDISGDKNLTEEERKIAIKNAKKILPLFVRNILSSFSMAKDGVELRGDTIIKSDDLDWRDVTLKFMGFNPLEVSQAYEEQFSGIPAKFSRINGRIDELKKIRKEIAASDKYDTVGKRNELLEIKRLMTEAIEERSRMMKQKEFRDAAKTGMVKLR